ncbi:MAG: DUF2284 domain-containing protein [Oscillospiraceae bacterium]
MYQDIKNQILNLGADNVANIKVSEIVFDTMFRKICESNQCGYFGTSWSCPPLAGKAEDLVLEAKTYTDAIVFNKVYTIEDSFDIEGMKEADTYFKDLTVAVKKILLEYNLYNTLVLGTGSCHHCNRCAAKDNKHCYFPEKQLHSMDAYCIYVSKLAESAQLKYINGKNTVTYFSVVLIKE